MKTFKPERYWVVLAVLCLAGCSDDTPLTFGCPNNDLRSESGKCGCDWPHPEKDDDKYWDESENRCIEPTSVCPGNVAAIDTDGDGTPDCLDKCPDDPDKTSEGVCGCDNPDIDDDHDGAIFCPDADPKNQDFCPNDPEKTRPGICGCGKPDIDDDHDGSIFCADGDSNNQDVCPENPYRSLQSDITTCPCSWNHPTEFDAHDYDEDGTIDCLDDLDRTKENTKTEPGVCGFGIPDDLDTDGDGTPDCLDPYPYSPCTDDSNFFDKEKNLYCIKTAADFLRLHEEATTLAGAKIHLLKDINLGDLDAFITLRKEYDTENVYIMECTFDFSKPKDPSKPDAERFLPDSFLFDLTKGAEFISADDEMKTIYLSRTWQRNYVLYSWLEDEGHIYFKTSDISCPLPYPFFDTIKDSKVARIKIRLNIEEDTIDPSKATASLAYSTQNAHLEDVIFNGTVKTTSTKYNISVGGLVSEDTGSTFKNVRCQSATINAPNSTYVGGIVGKTQYNPRQVAQSTIYHTSLDNEHTVSSITGKEYVGGVVGYLDYGSSVRNMAVSINTLTATDPNEAYGGAIIGKSIMNNIIKNIDLKFDKIEGSNIGGIIGASEQAPEIKNIITIGGSLSGKTVGGLMSVLPESIELQNIYTDVQKISGTTAAGGLFGSAEAGFNLNLVSNRVALIDGSSNVGAIVGDMMLFKPHTWTNVTTVTKITSTETRTGGFICNDINMKDNAKLTFQNTVIGGITNNTSYPMIATESLVKANCNQDNTCFEGTNAYYFYQTKPSILDPQSKLDSLFTPVHIDEPTDPIVAGVLDKLNAAFPMDYSWKTESITLGKDKDKTELTFPIFRDYLENLMGTFFEDPEDGSGEE